MIRLIKKKCEDKNTNRHKVYIRQDFTVIDGFQKVSEYKINGGIAKIFICFFYEEIFALIAFFHRYDIRLPLGR